MITSATTTVHSRCTGSGPSVVLLHGLFGAGSNLGALGRHLSRTNTVYAPDLPGHGRSDWCSTYTLTVMADALMHWMEAQSIEYPHMVGHSLGGKVAMQLALAYPDRFASLVIADIAPVRYAGSHGTVFAALESVALAQCDSRAQAQQIMQQTLVEEGVIDFLLASLRRDAHGIYRWMFDRQGLQRDYSALLEPPRHPSFVDALKDANTPKAGSATATSWSGPALFIKGEASDYINDAHLPVIASLFPAARVVTMPHCGHWLHVQNPQLFNQYVADFQAKQHT